MQNVPPFTHEAQRWIWERQNPDPGNCSAQQYYLGDNIPRQVRRFAECRAHRQGPCVLRVNPLAGHC